MGLKETLHFNRQCNTQVLAKKFGAAVVSLEHRYYGKSTPFKTTETKNLRYLSSKQALFDLAVFREQYQASIILMPCMLLWNLCSVCDFSYLFSVNANNSVMLLQIHNMLSVDMLLCICMGVCGKKCQNNSAELVVHDSITSW